jgi:hypothetical protein
MAFDRIKTPMKSMYSVKDLKDIDEYLSHRPRLQTGIASMVESSREIFRRDFESRVNNFQHEPLSRSGLARLLGSRVRSLSNEIHERAIALRALREDPNELLKGIWLHGRLLYIDDVSYENSLRGEYDCLQVFEIIEALSIKDTKLISAYLRQHPGPSKIGHPFTKRLCNTVCALLNQSIETEYMIQAASYESTKTDYDSLLLKCLNSIARGDGTQVSEYLTQLLSLYRKKYSTDGMLKYSPYSLHGILRLAEVVFSKHYAKQRPEPPSDRRWDHGFMALVDASEMDLSFELEGASGELNLICQELPAKLPAITWDSM